MTINQDVLDNIKKSGLVFELKHHRRFHEESSKCNGFEVWLFESVNDCVAFCCSECGQEQEM